MLMWIDESTDREMNHKKIILFSYVLPNNSRKIPITKKKLQNRNVKRDNIRYKLNITYDHLKKPAHVIKFSLDICVEQCVVTFTSTPENCQYKLMNMSGNSYITLSFSYCTNITDLIHEYHCCKYYCQ